VLTNLLISKERNPTTNKQHRRLGVALSSAFFRKNTQKAFEQQALVGYGLSGFLQVTRLIDPSPAWKTGALKVNKD
jgi:hypothetical protein